MQHPQAGPVALQTQRPRSAPVDRLTAGGTQGNERLTAATALVLLALLAALGITIVRIGQLLDVHMFLGVALIAPVVLKLASTGYRFARYYTGEPRYVAKGPPPLGLRLIAPVVVLSTVAVFATGVILLLAGPAARDPWVLLHKVSFFVWLGLMAIHVLGHLAELPRALSTRRALLGGRGPTAGGAGRGLALGASLALGTALGIASIAQFAAWAHHHR
jgi:hypothetical protein